MPTCATEENKSDKTPLSNLILPVPDTDFRDFLDEVEELAGFAAQIIEAIEKDPDAHAREKKKLRLANFDWKIEGSLKGAQRSPDRTSRRRIFWLLN